MLAIQMDRDLATRRSVGAEVTSEVGMSTTDSGFVAELGSITLIAPKVQLAFIKG